jgi:hypothetical protein
MAQAPGVSLSTYNHESLTALVVSGIELILRLVA